MGDPNETVTDILGLLRESYRDFERELPRKERAAYEELYLLAHRAMAPLNRKPDADFQRVALMAMMVGLCRAMRDQARRLARLEPRLRAAEKLLEQHGLPVEPTKASRLTEGQLDELGQDRITNYLIPPLRGGEPEREQPHALAARGPADHAQAGPVPA